jgi:hypothetical protein
MTGYSKLRRRLIQVEKELEKVRGCSVLTDGWQTQRYAKKARKWDVLAQERMNLLEQIEKYAIQSRKECPAKLICHCQKIPNWDGVCQLNKKK